MFGDTRQGRAGPEGHHLLFNFTIVGGKEVEERRWRKGGGGERKRWVRDGLDLVRGHFVGGEVSSNSRLKLKCSKILGLTSNSSFSLDFLDMYLK